MHRFALVPVLLLLTLSAFALDPGADKNITMLADDLHALGRVTAVAKDLPDSRQVLLAIVDSDVETLRMPRGDGTYQWASLQREEGGRVKDEKTVEQVSTEKELRYVTVTGTNGYRVEVTVPRKRGTFAANNRVWVRNVLVDSTAFDGKTSHQEIPVNAWVNPGDATGVPLADIGKSVKATAELGVESGNKAAVAEVALVQAKLVDDPNSPYFPAVKKLLQVRDLAAARDMNRGALKNTIDEALLSLPGELEKRTAEQEEAARVRKEMAESGMTTGAIHLGDATPDVANELAEIARMLNGPVQEQADGRARLEALIAKLKPAAPAM
jgi:transposase-like protein